VPHAVFFAAGVPFQQITSPAKAAVVLSRKAGGGRKQNLDGGMIFLFNTAAAQMFEL
jgi:hypothetical protein